MAQRSVVIIGSGFAGAILARILRCQGHDVALVERGAHPRFALGESSTPLAAICLERLAKRYGLDDLRNLAAYGRWVDRMPGVRRGLKRGFTFYHHQPGRHFVNDAENSARLLVAASPHDAVADAHWLREDVDYFLVRRALSEGVAYYDRTEVVEVEPKAAGFRLSAVREGRTLSMTADVVFDASGAGGVLARWVPIDAAVDTMPLRTGLLFGHFSDVPSFPDAARAPDAEFPPGPYPDERAAVHHMLREGWMYVLPFDHGVVSAGFVAADSREWRAWSEGVPEAAWRCLLGRYPTLERQFGQARAVRPIGLIPRLQRRLTRAAGANWALLPHAFCFLSPLFSTGIAWSLLGVERLALALESGSQIEPGLSRYGALLEGEATHLGRLIDGAYRAQRDFDLFCAHTFLYFAAVSFAEAAQRLRADPADEAAAWDGFAGSADPVLQRAVAECRVLLDDAARTGSAFVAGYFDAVRRLIEPRNVAGLADPARRRLYPVDLSQLVDHADRLGLTVDEARRGLARLRGGA